MVNVTGGMRLAPNQPGWSVNPATTHVADPKHHRLGIMKMKIGSTHSLRDRQTGKVQHLVVRELSQVPEGAELVIVCLHPACAGKQWKPKDFDDKGRPKQLLADHPPHKVMVEGGERHVFGWYSSAPLAAEDAQVTHTAKLITRAEGFVALARKTADEAKDVEAMKLALEQIDLAEKNLAGLKAMQSQQANQIIGFASDEHFEVEGG